MKGSTGASMNTEYIGPKSKKPKYIGRTYADIPEGGKLTPQQVLEQYSSSRKTGLRRSMGPNS